MVIFIFDGISSMCEGGMCGWVGLGTSVAYNQVSDHLDTQGDSDSPRFGRISDSDPSGLVIRYVRSMRTYSHAPSPVRLTVGIFINV